ncbi:hypothetical protein MTP03_03550 [Tsukamurella sp. PLM1]|nr:hypothetical protein MTP03_03550 [Tsukamurella sp. PLM1]
MLAQQNIEQLDEVFDGLPEKQRKIVVTCAHCFNALGNEYPQVGGKYEVVHHTQLLNKLVREKRLVPVAPPSEDVTYHDPCYLGRHNQVYEAPRELIGASGATLKEMPRHLERSMCCGAGGARMWMEEQLGKRINIDRVDEALNTLSSTPEATPKKIATGCPFCRVMLSDGVTAQTAETPEQAPEVVDVAQMLLESVKRGLPEGIVLGNPNRKVSDGAAALAESPAEAPPAQAAPQLQRLRPLRRRRRTRSPPWVSDSPGAASARAGRRSPAAPSPPPLPLPPPTPLRPRHRRRPRPREARGRPGHGRWGEAPGREEARRAQARSGRSGSRTCGGGTRVRGTVRSRGPREARGRPGDRRRSEAPGREEARRAQARSGRSGSRTCGGGTRGGGGGRSGSRVRACRGPHTEGCRRVQVGRIRHRRGRQATRRQEARRTQGRSRCRSTCRAGGDRTCCTGGRGGPCGARRSR